MVLWQKFKNILIYVYNNEIIFIQRLQRQRQFPDYTKNIQRSASEI